MSLFEYIDLSHIMWNHFLISPRTFQENHISGVWKNYRTVVLPQISPSNRIEFATFFWMVPKRSNFEIQRYVLKRHVSCFVLSQDSNSVVFIGAQWSEPPKNAIEINDVMTLHSTEPSGGRKWKEWLQIWHVDLLHVGLQHVISLFEIPQQIEIFKISQFWGTKAQNFYKPNKPSFKYLYFLWFAVFIVQFASILGDLRQIKVTFIFLQKITWFDVTIRIFS